MAWVCRRVHHRTAHTQRPPDWTLRPANADDREFLFALNDATMREYVDATWGWNDSEQRALFDKRFEPERLQILQVADVDVGVLSIVDGADEIFLSQIQVLPEWQGRGIGSSVIRHLISRGAAEGKPVTLRVLRANPRAAALYDRLGFEQAGQIATHT
jgi:ribosomal protein S18 acetylase RimI-like enzyme